VTAVVVGILLVSGEIEKLNKTLLKYNDVQLQIKQKKQKK